MGHARWIGTAELFGLAPHKPTAARDWREPQCDPVLNETFY